MKISSKLMLGLITCVFISQLVQSTPKSDKKIENMTSISSDSYERDLSSALSSYLMEITMANGDQSKITKAMGRYDKQLSKIDHRYPDQVKAEAFEHAAKMAAQREKWHNYDEAYKALKGQFAKELDPYWQAEQALVKASFNQNTRKDQNLRKLASEIFQKAMQGLQFQYRDALAKFNIQQQALQSKYDF